MEIPYMANDPSSNYCCSSLRYMAHLVAPGWNVIGGGEPEIPGISIGHNGIGAWGLLFLELMEKIFINMNSIQKTLFNTNIRVSGKTLK